NHTGFTAPGDMPSRIASFCEQTGQRAPEGPGETVRCIVESLALKHADTVDLVARVAGRELRTLHVVGGGARNELLCDLTAAASGRPGLAGPQEATLVGSGVVQAMALGEIASLDEAREVVRASFAPREHEPRDAERWREARGRFAELSGTA